MKQLRIALLFMILFSVWCVGCVPDQYEPEEGIWYCDELQIQLSYESDAECFVIKDGEKIRCACGSDRGVNHIEVSCQHENHPDYRLAELIFSAEIISLNESELLVYDEQTDRQYVFLRIG